MTIQKITDKDMQRLDELMLEIDRSFNQLEAQIIELKEKQAAFLTEIDLGSGKQAPILTEIDLGSFNDFKDQYTLQSKCQKLKPVPRSEQA